MKDYVEQPTEDEAETVHRWRRRGVFPKYNMTITERLVNINLDDSDPFKEVPMEIESSGSLSSNSSDEFERYTTNFSTIDSRRQIYEQTLVKVHANETFNKQYREHNSFSFIPIVATILIVAIFVIFYGYVKTRHSFTCKNSISQLEFIKRDLHSVVYQSGAVSVILHTLKRIDFWSKPIKLLPFIGPTGVGKTFVANILKRHFTASLVHEFNGHNLPNIQERKEIFENVHTTCCNLIIIENLRAIDLDKVVDFIAALPEGRKALVIPIFNVHHSLDGWKNEIRNKDYDLIGRAFDQFGFYHELVFFNVVTVAMIEKWLRQELHKRNIEQHKHEQLIRSVIDAEQVQRKGFKGISTKLLLALDNVF